ncbi:unnamed protein product, partial [Ascophyllum nodosum]
TACFSILYSCAPENLVSRGGFGSPVPRQLFFVPSEIGSTRVIRYIDRVIRSRVQRSGSKNTRDIPRARHQGQIFEGALMDWETVSRSMPVVKLLSICDNQCSSSLACLSL